MPLRRRWMKRGTLERQKSWGAKRDRPAPAPEIRPRNAVSKRTPRERNRKTCGRWTFWRPRPEFWKNSNSSRNRSETESRTERPTGTLNPRTRRQRLAKTAALCRQKSLSKARPGPRPATRQTLVRPELTVRPSTKPRVWLHPNGATPPRKTFTISKRMSKIRPVVNAAAGAASLLARPLPSTLSQ